MTDNMTTTTLEKIGGLEWARIFEVPARKIKSGDIVVHSKVVGKCERLIAHAIATHPIPIRGAEVKFIRKFLGLSMEKFGKVFGVSGPCIHGWEREHNQQLSPVTEVSIRIFLGEKLGLNTCTFSGNVGHAGAAEGLRLKA